MIYLGKVKKSGSRKRDGFCKIEHKELGGTKYLAPIMNVPGTLKTPAEDSDCLFVKCVNSQGEDEFFYLGEAASPTQISLAPEELASETITGLMVGGNNPRETDYDDAGILCKTRYQSPNNMHSIEMKERVNPALDGEGPVQEEMGIEIKTQDGKFLDFNDGIQDGMNKITLGLDKSDVEEGSNRIVLNGGTSETGVKSCMITFDTNIEILSKGKNNGALVVGVEDGTGNFDIEHGGDGVLNIKGNATLNIQSKGNINITSTGGIVSINGTPQTGS